MVLAKAAHGRNGRLAHAGVRWVMLTALALVVVTSTASLSREDRLGVSLIHAQQRADLCEVDLGAARAMLRARTATVVVAQVAPILAPEPAGIDPAPLLGAAGFGIVLGIVVAFLASRL